MDTFAKDVFNDTLGDITEGEQPKYTRLGCVAVLLYCAALASVGVIIARWAGVL